MMVYIDAGHGGLHPVTGKYCTFPQDGKEYTFVGKGFVKPLTIFEGVINRKIAWFFMELLTKNNIAFRQIHHDFLDTRNIERCSKANGFAFQDIKNGYAPIYMSFHSNAFGMKAQGGGEAPKGLSFWTTKGTTESDKIANIWYEEAKKELKNTVTYRHDLSDNDTDFEENFTVLLGTQTPAVLIENLFFTNKEDAILLLNEVYQKQTALIALKTVQRYEKEK